MVSKDPKKEPEVVIDRSKCFFCENKSEPDYKEYEILGHFISRRAKILSRRRSGVCAKHQRKLSTAIKRARHLGLAPYQMDIS